VRQLNVAHCGLLLLICLSVVGCTDGPLDIKERYYLNVTDDRNTNHYRITVSAHTQLSKAEFRQGWYPEDAVDALFGNVSEEAGIEQLRTERTLRENINKTLIALDEKYQQALLKEDSSKRDKELKAIRKARSELFLVPLPEHGRDSDSRTIEYHPAKNLITRRSGQKLLFILSADPDKIIEDIAEFSESEKTQAEILDFAKLVVDATTSNVQVRKARAQFAQANDAQIASEIQQTLQAINGISSIGSDEAADNLSARLEALSTAVLQYSLEGN